MNFIQSFNVNHPFSSLTHYLSDPLKFGAHFFRRIIIPQVLGALCLWISSQIGLSGMAPKKKNNNQEGQGSVGPTLPTNVNEGYFVEFQKALDTIRAHKCFENIITCNPLARDGVAAFNDDDMKKALVSKGGSGSYIACGNLFWVDFLFSTMRGVPFNKTNIELLVNHQFSQPKSPSSHIEIAVADPKHLEPQGSWRSVTPEEKLHAMVWAIHRDVVNPEVKEKVIKDWVNAVLNVTFLFRVIATEDWGTRTKTTNDNGLKV